MNLTMIQMILILIILSEHNWLSQTREKFMKYVIYTLSDGIESRPIPNKNQKLVSFKKGIKREETVYPTL